MRRRLWLLSPFLLLIFALSTSVVIAQEEDDLRRRIEEAGDAKAHGNADRVVIFDRTLSDVQDSGLTYVTQERLWKILKPSGGKALRSTSWDYDPLYGMVRVEEARIYRKDGSIEEIPLDENVHDYPAPARGIYWGLRQLALHAGRLETGDALYVKSFRKGFTYALLAAEDDDERFAPPMRGHFYDIVEFWSSRPVMEKTYTALLPADKPLQYEVYNGEVQSSIHFEGDKVKYVWTKKDIKPFKSEPNQVAASDVACKLLMSTAPDWFAKSEWFHKVNEDYGSFEVTPEVKAKVDELLMGVEDDEDKVRILTHWVANEIRYSGISMGRGEGFTLHKGETIFYDRCGVCKDKAGMLVTMLRAAGFESYPAMTMAGSRIDYIPADQFNHCVTLIRHDGNFRNAPGFGEYKLLDPTWVPFMRELWSSAEQQQNYLPGTPKAADLQITQLSAPKNHYFRIKGSSKLDAGGDLEGSFTLVAEGQSDAAIRWNMVRRRYKSMWHEYIDGVIHAISPRAELVNAEYGDPYDLADPIRIKIDYRIPRYARTAGDRILVTPVVARYPFSDTARFLTMNLDLKDRKFNFRARTSRLVELSETLELPEGYKAVHLPEYEATKGSGAAFKGGYKEEDGKVLFELRLELKKRIYEPSDYESFSKAVKGVKHMMDNAVVLGR